MDRPQHANEFYTQEYFNRLHICDAIVKCIRSLTDMELSVSYGHTKVRHGESWDNPDDWHWKGGPGVSFGSVKQPYLDLQSALEFACLLEMSVEIVSRKLCKVTRGTICVEVPIEGPEFSDTRSATRSAICEACLQLADTL